jgi:hypothetical protein
LVPVVGGAVAAAGVGQILSIEIMSANRAAPANL